MEGIEFRASSRHLGDGTRVVAVAGEVDLYTAPEFGRALELNGSADGRIVIDLSECTFLDSTGLGILVQATRPAAATLSSSLLAVSRCCGPSR
jgi:anti-sigma B factor antagonist